MKNPKQIAIEAIEKVVDTVEAAQDEAVAVASPEPASQVEHVDHAEHSKAREDRRDTKKLDIQNQIDSITDPDLRREAQARLDQAVNTGGSLSAVRQDVNVAQTTSNDKDARELQQAAMGAITGVAAGVAAFGAMADLKHLNFLDGKNGPHGTLRDNGFILFNNHTDKAYDNPNVLLVENSHDRHHFTGVINPGSRVAMMTNVSKGQEVGGGRSVADTRTA